MMSPITYVMMALFPQFVWIRLSLDSVVKTWVA
ncbi:hypothetical protein PI124_g22183 [Phytophthora idaei]|nr:hypothetical protein PI125_g21482 [Phytophthora idaei]KAG3127066.1 hypothetical protein PI126_g22031 [Phytophthora idaei]KAG3232736.1 hypothetical protein PI124_g22183 [Phytophthora idaei]